MKGEGRSHGSITVINAMPCGIGATMGVDLNTTATFEETDGRRSVTILNDGSEDKNMARICVSRAYEYAKMDESDGWNLVTDSEIPVSRGLKSSSCACNAIVFSVIGVDIDPVDLIRLGVDCAREARVTVTGSFDDACGCGLGGLVMTDNRRDEILARSDIGDYDVVIHVPEFKIKKTGLPLDRLHEVGALGAGMSGSGPAVAIVVAKGDGESFAKDLGIVPEELILTRTRCGE